VRAIATAHGGHVDVDSRPGTGTTFTLRLGRAIPPRPDERLAPLRAVAQAG
jgi:signal transduction histidine kinase